MSHEIKSPNIKTNNNKNCSHWFCTKVSQQNIITECFFIRDNGTSMQPAMSSARFHNLTHVPVEHETKYFPNINLFLLRHYYFKS